MPDKYWRTEDMLAAFATRKIGAVFIAYRRSPFHVAKEGVRGVTQARLARWLHMTQSHVSKIERGLSQTDRINQISQWFSTLGVPNDLQWASTGSPTEQYSNDLKSSYSFGLGVSIEASPTTLHEVEFTDMALSRRVFLRGAGASAALGVPSDFLPTGSGAVRTSESLSEIDPLQHFHQMKTVLMDSDNLFGPAQVIPAVQAQIEGVVRLRGNAGSSTRKKLLSIQAQFSDLLGWLHQDAGNHPESSYWIDRSLESAHGSGSVDTVAFMLARKCHLAGELGNANDAIDLGNAAFELAVNGRVSAVAATYAAYGHAMVGNESESYKLYDTARALVASNPPAPEDAYGLFLDLAYIDVQQARAMVVLGRNAAAIEKFEASIAQLPASYRRDIGLYLAWCAIAYAHSNELDCAIRMGERALLIGNETRSARISLELSRLNESFNGQASEPAVIDFRRQLPGKESMQ